MSIDSLALLTDLYQLTMAYGYWKAGITERQAIFHLNFRKWPFQGGYAIAAGLKTAMEFIQNFRFSSSDLSYLESLKKFETSFLDFLSRFTFCCDVDAIEEGTVVFPFEPLIRIKGPIWQAQLLESPLLNIINFQTLIATKSARICLSAFPDPVIEFGMRRAQGMDGAISASRAAYIGGCEGTSNVLAGKLFGIPVRGTHAHSWIMAFEEEKTAFEEFAKIASKGSIFLIDTYDSLRGTQTAIEVAKKFQSQGFELAGVRMDSGDLAKLSIEIRHILDKAGFSHVQIMASNELDEYLIRDLKQQGAKINLWGVGTHLVTGKEQPALDGVYKLSAIQNQKGEWEHRLKLTDQTAKVTNPGCLQVRRYFEEGKYRGDVIWDELLDPFVEGEAVDLFDVSKTQKFSNQKLSERGHDLLVPIFRNGKQVYQIPSLEKIQARAKQELFRLSPTMTRLVNPELYFVGLEEKLYRKKLELIHDLKSKR